MVGALVYIGAIDRFSYGWQDVIRVRYVVANRGVEPDTIWAEASCNGISITEDWCVSPGDSIHGICGADQPIYSGFCVARMPPSVHPQAIVPGEHLIREITVPVSVPDQDPPKDSYVIGHVYFYAPSPPPRFTFELRYSRPGQTSATLWSWGQVKRLFR
jgi:hypothetical protein